MQRMVIWLWTLESSVMNGGAMLVTRAVAMHHRFDAANKSKASKSCCCIAT